MLVTMPSGILQAQQHRTIRYSKASDAPKAYDVLTGLKQLYTYDDYGNVQDATANMHKIIAGPYNGTLKIPDATGLVAGTAGFYAKDKYYDINCEQDRDTWQYNSTLTVYDVKTWQKVDTHSFPKEALYSAICYDSSNDLVYFITSNENNETELRSLSLTDYSENVVGTLNGSGFVQLVADSKGYLYAMSNSDYHLYKINRQTAAVEDLGELMEDIEQGVQGAVYDSKNNIIYHMTPTWQGYTQLNAIHINDNFRVDSLTSYPKGIYFNGIYFPETSNDAPNAAENLAFEPDGNNPLNVTITFNVPTTTFGEGKLTGDITAHLSIDGKTDKMKVQPGENFSTKRLLTNGPHFIAVSLENKSGLSRERMLRAVTGFDQPDTISNLKYSVSGTTARLSWTAPEQGKNGGKIDRSSLSYTVIRTPGNYKVAQGLKATSFEEPLPEAYANYAYKVVAEAGGVASDTAYTKPIFAGTDIVPPYVNDFSNDDENSLYKELGNASWNLGAGYAFGMPNKNSPTHSYLVTMPIRLSKEQAYRIGFDAHQNDNDPIHPTKVVVLIGKQLSLDALNRELVDTLILTNSDFSSFATDFTVDADGLYYMAIGNVGEDDQSGLILDNLSIVPAAGAKCPAAVSALESKQAEKGALQTTLSFKAPTTTVNGNALSNLTKIDVFTDLNAEPAYTFTNPTPGTALSWNNESARQGFTNYYIVASNSEGEGMATLARAFAGEDVPTEVQNLTVKGEGNTNTLSWTAPVTQGPQGGYVTPSNVTYTVTAVASQDSYDQETVASNIKELTATQQLSIAEGQKQARRIYTVTPSNSLGKGKAKTIIGTVGSPYALPFRETFTKTTISKLPFTLFGKTTMSDESTPMWKLANGNDGDIKPVTPDGGFIQFVNPTIYHASESAVTPMIDIHGAQHPALCFYMFHGEETDEGDTHLKIFANPDFKGNVEIADLDYNDYETNGWKHHIIDLDKVKGANSIILSFQAITLDGTVPISLDNISVINRPEYALSAANLDMPVRLTVGKSVIAHGMVTNTGRKDITNYSVTLLKNGQPVDVKNDQRGIAAGESTSFDFNVTPSAVDANDTIDYSLKVESESSQTVSDTSTTVSVYIDDNKVPSINDLAGTETEDGVTLKWSTPTPERAAAITDDFDSYDPYLIEGFGDWTTVDGDGAGTQYPAWAQITPNWKAPQAWQTFNWNQAGFNEGNYLSHSGEQSLVSWSATTNMWGVELCARNDNWLISPEVVPGSDIKLWMRGYEIDHLYGPEHFQILYSPESTDTTTFQLMAVDSLTSTKWRYFEYTLPRTAKYFAIRSITPERGFGIILDDLGYTPANGEAEALTLAHFNIYRDGKLIDTSLIPTFTDKPGDKANHSYQVSAVFEEGESALSNTYVYDVTNTIDKTAISSSSPVAVYGLDGRKVDRNQKGIVMIKKKNRSVVKELRQ